MSEEKDKGIGFLLLLIFGSIFIIGNTYLFLMLAIISKDFTVLPFMFLSPGLWIGAVMLAFALRIYKKSIKAEK